MTTQGMNNDSESGWSSGGCLVWFVGGITLSITTICSLVLLVMFVVSTALNVYLGWEMSGVEVVIKRPIIPVEAPVGAGPTPTEEALVEVPVSALQEVENTSTPVPAPTESPLIAQLSTLAAMATEAAQNAPVQEGVVQQEAAPSTDQVVVAQAEATPNAPVAAQPITANDPEAGAAFNPEAPAAEEVTTPAQEGGSSNAPMVEEAAIDTGELSSVASISQETATSSNQYELIPLEGNRDPRPAAEHGDLNLKLRTPQRTESSQGRALIDLSGGADSNAPNFLPIFEPNFTAEYTAKNWDWGCNCPTDWIEGTAMMGLKTTPGAPIFIPRKEQDIFQGKYYAVLLYASEDLVTFAYSRDGTVAHSYAVHYYGLKTDPNLLALYRSSAGNQLPGLTLDTPIGTASNELIVAIRDKGAFMDLRSQKDWWR